MALDLPFTPYVEAVLIMGLSTIAPNELLPCLMLLGDSFQKRLIILTLHWLRLLGYPWTYQPKLKYAI
jgi:hypothetical protein